MPNFGAKRLMQSPDSETEAGLLTIWKNVSDPIFYMWSDHTIPVFWFTDGSRANSETGSGIFGLRPNKSLSFPLGKFATVFQTEIYAILKCSCENIRRAYKNKQILIFSDSQSTLKALSRPKITSELVTEFLNALSALADLNELTLVWVPGHRGILGNEEADKLARQVSVMPLPGPEPALGITKCSAREAI
jgi:ribonuclease HI